MIIAACILLFMTFFLGFWARRIALGKGRNGYIWFVIGFLFGIFGVIAAALMTNKKPTHIVNANGDPVIICHHCGKESPMHLNVCANCHYGFGKDYRLP